MGDLLQEKLPGQRRGKIYCGVHVGQGFHLERGEDYFVVVKMADDLVKEDDYLGGRGVIKV